MRRPKVELWGQVNWDGALPITRILLFSFPIFLGRVDERGDRRPMNDPMPSGFVSFLSHQPVSTVEREWKGWVFCRFDAHCRPMCCWIGGHHESP